MQEIENKKLYTKENKSNISNKMKPLKVLVIIFMCAIIVVSIILPFLGFNYFTKTITELGFFPNNRLIHDPLMIVIFLGGFLTILIWFILNIAHKKKRAYFEIFCLLPFFLIIIYPSPILEWMSFWALCVWTIIKITL